jgi:hypothetical protein
MHARSASEASKIGIFQQMAGKRSELDNWSVFHMALCVACFIVLTLRRLLSTKATIMSTHCTSNCVDLSSRHILGVF